MKWTEAEINFLKENYEQHGVRYCMEKYGRSWDSVKKKASELQLKVNKIHTNVKSNDSYDLELFEKEINILRLENYINNRTPILHECIEGHRYKVTPTNVLKGIGCPSCSKYGFDSVSPATLYFISLSNYSYKIGITKHVNPIDRFPKREHKLSKIEWSHRFNTGQEARELEQKLLKQYGKNNANEGILESGNTECLYEYIPKPENL